MKAMKPNKEEFKQKQDELEAKRAEKEKGFLQHLQELYEFAVQKMIAEQRVEMRDMELGYLSTEQACRRSECRTVDCSTYRAIKH